MNEKIDLTNILKDCTKGTKLYSSVFGEVKFVEIDEYDKEYPIIIQKLDEFYRFTIQGELYIKYGGECTLFPSKDQRDWSKFTAPWYKKDKFDPKTLQCFDKVLVRDFSYCTWECGLFSDIKEHDSFPYRCIGRSYNYCIPYNDKTKYLVGTRENAPFYYRYWEE